MKKNSCVNISLKLKLKWAITLISFQKHDNLCYVQAYAKNVNDIILCFSLCYIIRRLFINVTLTIPSASVVIPLFKVPFLERDVKQLHGTQEIAW